MTVTCLGLCAGMGVGGLAALNLLGSTLTLNPINVMINTFQLVFGLTMCALELKHLDQLEGIRKWFQAEMHILYTPYGRSGFYMLAGCFLMATPGFLNFVVGAFTCGVGFLGSISAKIAMDTLSSLLDEQYDERSISSHFDRYDVDRSGDLDPKELAAMCQELLSKTLTEGQIEAAIFALDSNRNGKVGKKEFLEWWKKAKEDRENGGMLAGIKNFLKTIIPIPIPFL